MENALKAFYMAAGMLIAIMILGLFIYLFKTGARFGENYDLTKSQEQIDQFNSKFEVYVKGVEENKDGIIYSGNTIFDIITLSNLAYDINEKNGNDDKNRVEIEINGFKTGSLSIGIPKKLIGEENVLKKNSFFKSIIKDINETTETVLMDDILVSSDIVSKGKLTDAIVNLKADNEIKLNRIIYRYYFICEDKDITYSEVTGKVNKMVFTLKENTKFDDLEIKDTP